MTIHFQKNKAAPRLLILALLCCLFCVSLPAASAASSDEGWTEGVFKFGNLYTNANIMQSGYSGSQSFTWKVTQTGVFTGDSSFNPRRVTPAFVATATGSVTINLPAFEITVPVSGGPVCTSPNNFISLIDLDVTEIVNGASTTERQEIRSSFWTKTEGSYRTYTTGLGVARFNVKEGARYTLTLTPYFEFNASSEVGSFLSIKSLGSKSFPFSTATSSGSQPFPLKPYVLTSSPFLEADPLTYPVTVIADEGCTVAPFSGFSFPVEHGSLYYFTVDIADGYLKTDDFSVKVNGVATSPIVSGAYKGAYRASSPTGEQTIEVTGVEKAFYTVALSDGVEGCRLVPYGDSSLPVPYGSDFTFTIELDDDYLKTTAFSVYANGVWVPVSGGAKTCTIYNITADQFIAVTGVEKRPEYYITFSEGEGYLIHPRFTSPVDGTSFYRFSVEILEGYRKSDSFRVLLNGEPLEAESGDVYGFRARGDIHFTIEGVERIPRSYPVTFSDSGGYTVVPVAGSSFTVEEGGTFRFMVQIEAGYRKTADFAVSDNGVKLTAVNGEYRIDNITSPQKISVSGVIAIPGVDPGHKPDYKFDTDTTDFVYDTISLFDRVIDTALSFPVLLFFGSVAVVLICFAIFQGLYSRGKRGRNH